MTIAAKPKPSAAQTKLPESSLRPKRRGRPIASEAGIGREALKDITRELMRTTPPLELTRLKVAQAANVAPKLIQYYFGTVGNLITEVVVDNHRRIHGALLDLMKTEKSLEWIRGRIAHMVDLFIENPYQHQLIRHVMYRDRDSREHQEWVHALRESIEYTKSQMALGVKQGLLRPVDPHMVHLVLIGVGEIFGGNPDVVADIFDGQSVADLRDRYVEFIFNLFIFGLHANPSEALPAT